MLAQADIFMSLHVLLLVHIHFIMSAPSAEAISDAWAEQHAWIQQRTPKGRPPKGPPPRHIVEAELAKADAALRATRSMGDELIHEWDPDTMNVEHFMEKSQVVRDRLSSMKQHAMHVSRTLLGVAGSSARTAVGFIPPAVLKGGRRRPAAEPTSPPATKVLKTDPEAPQKTFLTQDQLKTNFLKTILEADVAATAPTTPPDATKILKTVPTTPTDDHTKFDAWGYPVGAVAPSTPTTEGPAVIGL